MQDRDGWKKGVRAWWKSAWILGSNMRIEEWRRRVLRAMMVIVGSDRLVDMDDGTRQYSAK